MMNKKDRIAAFILGIDFTPNYEDWWNKPDLTKEELIWLMVGISPQDMSHYRTLEGKTDKTPDEEKWCQNFSNYFDNKYLFWRYGSNRHQECEQCAISWDNKKQFIQDAYNAFIAIDDGFLDYLESKGAFQKNPDLEKYKGWRQYQLDLENADFDWRINTEEEAFAVFLGLEPGNFKRYYALKLKKENRNKSLPFYLWLNELSPDDTWFFLLYRKFLRDTLPVYDTLIDDLKRLNLWPKVSESVKPWVNSNFSGYVKALHNHGVVFSPSFMRAFKKHVLPDWQWGYDENSEIWQFYHHWVKRVPTWTLEEAVDLFKGYDPILHQSHIINLAVSEFLLSSHPNGQEKNSPRILQAYEKYPFAQTGLHIIELQERLQRYVAAGKTQIAHQPFQDRPKEGWLFEPKAIYRFLNEATLYQPPLALHSAVGDTFEGYLDKQDSNVRETDDGPVLKNRLDSNTHDNRRKELERLKEKMQQAGIQDGEYSQDDIAIFLVEKSLEFKSVGHEHIKNIIKESQIFRFDKGRQPEKKKADKIPLENRINWDE